MVAAGGGGEEEGLVVVDGEHLTLAGQSQTLREGLNMRPGWQDWV